MKICRMVPFVLALSLVSLSAGARPADDAHWPSFRGANAAGVSSATDLPSSWNVESGHNVRWALDLPGVSHSSAVVWGDRIFVISALSSEPRDSRRVSGVGNMPVDDAGEFDWRLYSIDAADGRIAWSVSAHEGRPRTHRHEKSSRANSTPATDGRYLVAIFASEGLFCYDMHGTLLWRVDLGLLDTGLYGDPSSQWGYAASPTLHEDRVFVQVDRHRDSFIAAFRLEDGSEIWRTPRAEKNTWSTPTVYRHDGRDLVVTNGGNYIRAYDAGTGDEVWRFADDAEVKVPTPFAADGRIIVSGGYPQGRPVYAFEQGARGDVSGRRSEALAWRIPSGGPYTATPVAYEGRLYSISDSGILAAYDLATGERLFRERLGDTFSASPVAADGKVYLASEQGNVFVVRAGDSFELIATNDMGEPLFATPALVDGMVVVRGRDRLFALGD